MPTLHAYFGLALVAVFLVLGVWGLISWFRNRHPGEWFWRTLAVGQVGLGIQLIVGLILFVLGRRRSLLHYAYGIFPILVLVIAHRYSKRLEGLEWAVFAFAGFVNFGLLLRAYMTGMGR